LLARSSRHFRQLRERCTRTAGGHLGFPENKTPQFISWMFQLFGIVRLSEAFCKFKESLFFLLASFEPHFSTTPAARVRRVRHGGGATMAGSVKMPSAA